MSTVRPPPSDTLAGADKDNRAAASRAIDFILEQQRQGSTDAIAAQTQRIVATYRTLGMESVANIIQDLHDGKKSQVNALVAVQAADFTIRAPQPQPSTPSRTPAQAMAASALAAILTGGNPAALNAQQQQVEADAARIAIQGAPAAAAALTASIRSGQGNFGGGPAIDTTAPRPSAPVASAPPPESSTPDTAAMQAEMRRRMAAMAALGLGGERVQVQAPTPTVETQASQSSSTQTAAKTAWVYDMTRDPENIRIKAENERNKIRNEEIRAENERIRGRNEKLPLDSKERKPLVQYIATIPLVMREEVLPAKPTIDVSYNPKTGQQAPANSFYWTKTGEMTATQPADLLGTPGMREAGSGAAMTVAHPDKGELRPVPTAKVDKEAFEKAGGIVTPAILATDLRTQGYVYRELPPAPAAPGQISGLGQQERRAAGLQILQEAMRARGLATAAGVQAPPKGEISQTFQVAAAPVAQTPAAPAAAATKNIQSMGVLGNKDKPLTENYAAAVKAMQSIQELDATQAATVIQSFKEKYPKFAQVLQNLRDDKVSFLKAGDVLHNANREYQNAAPAQVDPRAATAAGDLAEAARLRSELETGRAQIEARLRAQLAPHVTPNPQGGPMKNIGELFVDPKVKEEVTKLFLRVAKENGIDPTKLSAQARNAIGAQIAADIEKNTARLEEILRTKGAEAAIKEYLKINEEALLKAIKPSGDRLSPTSLDDTAPAQAISIAAPTQHHVAQIGQPVVSTMKI